MKTFGTRFALALVFSGVATLVTGVYVPVTQAALATGESCVCTATDKSGDTKNFDATSASDCSNASNSSWTCSLSYTPPASKPDAGFTALVPIKGLTDTVPRNGGFAAFFDQLYIYLIGAAVILAVIMIVWGGLEYSTQDSVSKKSDGKSKIYNALFGLVLVLSPVLVFTIINPAILNLNVNFEPLKTTWENYKAPTLIDREGVNSQTTETTYTPCSDNASCDAAYGACGGTNRPSTDYYTYRAIVCLKPDGTKSGRTDYFWNSSYSCPSGDTLNVECYYYKKTTRIGGG